MNESRSSDGELIRRYVNGDDSAFDTLYHRYRKQLYAYLNRLLPGQPHRADDVYQQTWARVLENLPRYTEKQRFLSWAFRIAHNLVVDHFRRDAHVERVEITERLAGEAQDAWRELDRRDLRTALAAAVEELTPEQREVFLLRQQDVPFKEIAVIQETGINTVLGRMHYATRNLRKLLRDWL